MTKKGVLVQGAGCLVLDAGERIYKTTTFAFDGANQLVSSTTDGAAVRPRIRWSIQTGGTSSRTAEMMFVQMLII